jgi:hypothetical protein
MAMWCYKIKRIIIILSCFLTIVFCVLLGFQTYYGLTLIEGLEVLSKASFASVRYAPWNEPRMDKSTEN